MVEIMRDVKERSPKG